MNPMLELLGNRLLATSVQTVLLTALVWALCRFVKRLPASTQCALWWLVAVQAVVGLLWAAPLELPVLPAAEAVTVMQQAQAAVPQATNALLIVMNPLPLDSGWSWLLVAMALWGAGVLVMALRTYNAWRGSRALLRHAEPCRDHKLNAALQLAAEAHGLRRAPRLMLSAAVDSPQLIGPWRPVLLLPARGLPRMADNDLDMALTHELVHLQRHDLWLGLVPALAQHLFFFHPLIHLAAREYGIAREAAVDAAVVAGDRHCRQHYGRLLLQLGVAPRPGAGLASASPTFLSLKRRLLMLQNTSSFSRIGAGLILVAVAAVGVIPLRLVAMPVPPAPPTPPAPPALTVPAAPPASPAPVAATKGKSVTHTMIHTDGDIDDMPVPPAPPAPPAAPAAPAAPPAPISTQGVIHLSNDHSRNAYVLLQGDHSIMNGSVGDLRRVRRMDDGNGVLWLRRDGKDYVVHDTATLARFQQVHAETMRLGDLQGKLGDQQGELGERQGEIGARMGEIGARIGELASEQAQLALSGGERTEAQRKAAAEARRRLAQARQEMDNPEMRAEMVSLSRQQSELGRQQAELGRQQAAASVRAQRETEQLIEQVIRDGVAKPVRG
ncbi:M56 family metallopeptidase [Stenotrophomonas sp. SY1]|uniref:M56 family metallopeptidase n=1 Tax=Stenotrophomonas sp. SY1 TaxID=477235 RepID=UPI001E421B71|nr:M56 family metallopeptidase [Stenotrophomonas sp. SY1]MCD9085259.1 M56 family metallopeptidase [Stenotrophomonas sp. SY1]